MLNYCRAIIAVAAWAWTLVLLGADLAQPEAGVVKITATVDGKRKTGTGFIVKLEPEMAYIVTAAHVVAGDDEPKVEFYTKQDSPVRAEVPRVEGENPRGLALLVVRGEKNLPAGLTALPLAPSSTLRLRDQVEVIGFPQGGGGWAVVSAQISSREGSEWILTGAIDEGNSGGPVLKQAMVVGVVTRTTQKFGRANTAALVRETLEGWGVYAPVQSAATPPVLPRSAQRQSSVSSPSAIAEPKVGTRKVKGARQLATLVGHQEAVTDSVFSPDGKSLASASVDGTIILWDVAARKALGEPLKGHTKAVMSVAFSPDGKALASASGDATVMIWEVVSLKAIGQPLRAEECQGGVWGVAFSPDGKVLAAACENDTVFLWDVASRTPRATFGSECDAPFKVAFSPDKKKLAAGTADGCIFLWDMQTLQPAGRLSKKVNSTPVFTVAFSPDSKTLASASVADAGAVMLWDLALRDPLGEPLKGHTKPAMSVAFSPDGNTLASASFDQTLILWDIATRKALGEPLRGHTDAVTSVKFSPDGGMLASASADKTVMLWELIFE